MALLDAECPATSDDSYDRPTDRVVEWSRAQPGPVPIGEGPASAR